MKSSLFGQVLADCNPEHDRVVERSLFGGGDVDKLMQVCGNELIVKEYNGRRVVTFQDIDTVHRRPEGTAKRNFYENREHFVEGVDYFRLTYNEARSTDFVQFASPNGLTVFTESGYLMIVKSLTDSLAWTVQRKLVNTYFRVQELLSRPKLPATYAEALRELADTVEQKALLEAKVEQDKPKVEFAERVKDATGTHTMAEAARLLGWPRNLLFSHLRKQHIFMSNNMPLARYMTEERPYFRVIENILPITEQGQVKPQTLVTPRGLIWLQKVVPPYQGHKKQHMSGKIKASGGIN